jgi:hypothetical protein
VDTVPVVALMALLEVLLVVVETAVEHPLRLVLQVKEILVVQVVALLNLVAAVVAEQEELA